MALNYVFTEAKELKVIDPIYGTFIVEKPFEQVIFAKEMQRLENITQNGFSYYEYPNLKNNERLSHSVGAFHVMKEILDHYGKIISKEDKDIALYAILLHDIGHGPFSHTFEKICGYSHEKRTTDILLGDTDVHEALENLIGEEKIRKIASLIAEINNSATELNKDNLAILLKSLVSHQLDADRLDYLQRDSYYAEIPTSIRSENIIKALGITVDENQNYELTLDKKAVAMAETVLLERFQKYRDVYFCDSSQIMNKVLVKIIELYRQNPNSVQGKLSDEFVKMAQSPNEIDLQRFLTLTDITFFKAFETIKETSTDDVLKYLTDESHIRDYQVFETNINSEKVKQELQEIFANTGKSLENTMSVFNIGSKVKLYKKDEGLKINCGNTIKDLSEVTNLIRPQEILEKKSLVVNLELLKIELGLSKEEFENYRERLEMLMEDLNKKPEEFELKYIIPDGQDVNEASIIQAFKENGFEVVGQSKKRNSDEYYDNDQLELLAKGGSLRIRTVTTEDGTKIKGTYKEPTKVGTTYSSRLELEYKLKESKLSDLKEAMKKNEAPVNLDNILPQPILKSETDRSDIVFEKDGVRVCLSLDNTAYTNHVLNEQQSLDRMVEIEALGNPDNSIVLNDIDIFFRQNFSQVCLNTESKYTRGIQKTREAYAKEKQKKDVKKSNAVFKPVVEDTAR